MNLKLPVIASLVMTVLLLSSCVNSDEDSIVYYDDTALTGFSLGTVELIHHTTAKDGTDSTYTTTYTPSSNLFYIDQQQGRVYNPDSLPMNADVESVIATISTKRGGVAVLELKDQEGNDSLAYYSSTDSIDFTQPVNVRVYNMSMATFRRYTINVNVHRQSGTEFNWVSTTCDGLSDVKNRRLVSTSTSTFLFGEEGETTAGFRLKDNTWMRLQTVTSLSNDACKNIIASGDKLYTLNNSSLLTSTDGVTWTTVASDVKLTCLLGAGHYQLYAMGDDGLYESADDGTTWHMSPIDDSTDRLPDDNFSFICKPSTVNEDTYKLLLFGTRNGVACTWSKVEENPDGTGDAQAWSYYDVDEFNGHLLPKWEYGQVIWYDNSLLAIGGDFSQWYQSFDEGLVWNTGTEETSYYSLPDEFPKEVKSFAITTDDSHYIYLSVDGDTRVWKGRLARTAWDKVQTVYTRGR